MKNKIIISVYIFLTASFLLLNYYSKGGFPDGLLILSGGVSTPTSLWSVVDSNYTYGEYFNDNGLLLEDFIGIIAWLAFFIVFFLKTAKTKKVYIVCWHLFCMLYNYIMVSLSSF